MALPSDTQGADSRLQVRFYKKSVQQEQDGFFFGMQDSSKGGGL